LILINEVSFIDNVLKCNVNHNMSNIKLILKYYVVRITIGHRNRNSNKGFEVKEFH